MDLAVKLDMFEGPLDLLLHLIRKNEVDIYDIPIAMITSQYLEYLDLMRELNIQIAGDFLVMASTLTHIKSRMLLPSYDASEDDEDEDDPRLDLVAQLKEHLRMRSAAERLENRLWLNRDVFARGGGKDEIDSAIADAGDGEVIEAGLFELVEAFRGLMSKGMVEADWTIPVARISIEDRMSQLLNMLKGRDHVEFDRLFQAGDKPMAIVTFLALLELMRLGLMKAYQQRLADAPGTKVVWSKLRLKLNPLAEEEPD